MKLLQKTGSTLVISKEGNPRYRGQGLFLCPVCNSEVIRPLDNGSRVATCGQAGCKATTKPTHGKSGKRLYNIWNGIRLRCDNPSSKAYKYYGGKGIKYPETWRTFEGFFMDMGLSYQDGLTIDRLNNKLDYSKENCCWITHEANCSKEKKKQVAKYSLNGEYLAVYSSVQSATEAEGYKFASSISKVARGEREQYRGFVWKYI